MDPYIKKRILSCLAASTLAVVCTIIILTENRCNNNDEKYVAVGTFDENLVSETKGEPNGYFMGKWNLFEYIGDVFSGMFQRLNER